MNGGETTSLRIIAIGEQKWGGESRIVTETTEDRCVRVKQQIKISTVLEPSPRFRSNKRLAIILCGRELFE